MVVPSPAVPSAPKQKKDASAGALEIALALRAGAGAASEPAQPARPKASTGRLAELLGEVAQHFEHSETPTCAQGWLENIAHLELFADEMRWLVGEDGRQDERERKQVEEHTRREESSPSVLRGDRDIHWARKQLRRCEAEHTRLTEALSGHSDEQTLAELKAVQEEIQSEEQRQRQVVADNRRREKGLARDADSCREVDANERALERAAKMEAEGGVLRLKNESLQSQVQEAEAQSVRAKERQRSLSERTRQISGQLESKEYVEQLQERRVAEERVKAEEALLQNSVAELHEQRKQRASSLEKSKREGIKEVDELESWRAALELEAQRVDHEEKQMQRRLRQNDSAAHPSPRWPRPSPRQDPAVRPSPRRHPAPTSRPPRSARRHA